VIGILSAIIITFFITTAAVGGHPITEREVTALKEEIRALRESNHIVAVEVGRLLEVERQLAELRVEVGKLRAVIEARQ
jgi:hypothetical protein